ncbi:hypothetical protein ROJ8625_03057 [Roseivivax jejudonensis]|uniref:DUF4386 domain-containing protein n=1 Tax=Roseivivax jejudonensis TaxID=1529041 RepID=A0A1X6ZSF7_9RHOB|nr:DUF4386 domain-containing protein [Roseivivax jejudonensis]SLN60223.1 hypothetical protein ROJ8625_03057 [Roseivivax jejudonensis]
MRAETDFPQIAVLRWAGLLYLTIIVCGIGAEVGLRAPLIDFADAGATAAAILGAPATFRLAIVADLVMAAADVALALLLFEIFRHAAPGLARAAMVFRLMQAGLIAANLLNMQAAWLVVAAGQDIAGLAPDQRAGLAALFLNLHAHGYDLGLVFFGINSLLTAVLIWHSELFPRWLGVALGAAGAVYLIGSGLRFGAPEMLPFFMPAYAVPVLAESAFCLALLFARRSAPAAEIS